MSSKKNTIPALSGKELIKSLSSNLPNNSGIYKMLDSNGKILYIGKAKSLKNRIYSYSAKNLSPRIEHMVSQIHNIDWVITKSEIDALILESDSIKKVQPKYNILLKDDKTFPFLKIELEHDFPRVSKFRTKQGTPSKGMFGPYTTGFDIKEYIKLIQQKFQIRTCGDSYFKNRIQPCILYQIKRCSAPCVNKISKEDYKVSIKQLTDFLLGKNNSLKNELIEKMELASNNNDFEQAIIYRERIKFLTSMNIKQSILLHDNQNSDFIALLENNENYLFNVFVFRNGHHYGSINFNPNITLEKNTDEIMEEFILQYYHTRELPDNIIINIKITEENSLTFKTLEQALSLRANKKIRITNENNSNLKEVMAIVVENARSNIAKQQIEDTKWEASFKTLEKYFQIPTPINRIEVYDNSHLYGTLSLGVLICGEISGFNKKAYKIFNMKDTSMRNSDDYAILKEVLTRRFKRINDKKDVCPDLVLIDGGKGQLGVAIEVIRSLGFSNLKIVGIAKGKNRNAGEETLYLDNGEELHPDKYSSTLHFIQMLRNEAHRFAITSLRKRKLKDITLSELDQIPDVGKERKKLLLKHFGSVENIKKSSLEELKQINGINDKIATKIFNWFN